MRGSRPGGGALVAALVLVALNLRPAIASVPPVLPDIQRDLGLSGTAAGVLTALPVVCLGLFAPAAARLAGRFGVDRAVAGALVVLGAGTLARAAGGVAGLYAATFLAGAGLAVGGALLPGIVKAHFPGDRAATVTGLYTTGLAGGALLAAALTVPLRNLFGGAWEPAPDMTNSAVFPSRGSASASGPSRCCSMPGSWRWRRTTISARCRCARRAACACR